MTELLFVLLVPQEFEAFEICRVFWTWYIGIVTLGKLNAYHPTHALGGLLFGVVFTVIFLTLVIIMLIRLQNLLPVVHDPFIASAIILLNISLPVAIGGKVLDKI